MSTKAGKAAGKEKHLPIASRGINWCNFHQVWKLVERCPLKSNAEASACSSLPLLDKISKEFLDLPQ